MATGNLTLAIFAKGFPGDSPLNAKCTQIASVKAKNGVVLQNQKKKKNNEKRSKFNAATSAPKGP